MKVLPHSHRRKRPALAPEDYKQRRRERRMGRTLQSEAVVRAWAERHGFALRVLNGGHHWLLEKGDIVAEWWPSSAKLALNRDYLRDYHAAHWTDVTAVLQPHLHGERVSKPADNAVRAPSQN